MWGLDDLHQVNSKVWINEPVHLRNYFSEYYQLLQNTATNKIPGLSPAELPTEPPKDSEPPTLSSTKNKETSLLVKNVVQETGMDMELAQELSKNCS